MRLIIKATSVPAAIKAAADRGISVLPSPAPVLLDPWQEVKLYVPASEMARVIDWFTDPKLAECHEGEGYPEGTLLLY